MKKFKLVEDTYRGYFSLRTEIKGVTLASFEVNTVSQWAKKLGVKEQDFEIVEKFKV